MKYNELLLITEGLKFYVSGFSISGLSLSTWDNRWELYYHQLPVKSVKPITMSGMVGMFEMEAFGKPDYVFCEGTRIEVE